MKNQKQPSYTKTPVYGDEIATELARQLIEQGMRTMRLIQDDEVLQLHLNFPVLPISIVKEKRMVSIELNANKAA